MEAKTNLKSRLPSRHATVGPDRAPHRAFYYAMGLSREQIAQPFVGVATCWNEAAPCNIALMRQAQVAKKGVAGLAGVVTVVHGDAFKEIPKIAGTFDFVFLDAWKPDYKRFFDLVFPRVVPRGLFLAHNVVNKESEMRDFLSAIKDGPAIATSIVRPGTEGIALWVKLK